jgi:hypothetical protein
VTLAACNIVAGQETQSGLSPWVQTRGVGNGFCRFQYDRPAGFTNGQGHEATTIPSAVIVTTRPLSLFWFSVCGPRHSPAQNLGLVLLADGTGIYRRYRLTNIRRPNPRLQPTRRQKQRRAAEPGMELTGNSVRSFLAPAIPSSSCLALAGLA